MRNFGNCHRRFWDLLLAGVLFLTGSHSIAEASADKSANKGLAIFKEADKRDSGFGDTSAVMEMILRNKQGQSFVRKMRGKVLEKQGIGDKSIFVFDDPADVKGTALLTFTYKREPDDQWLYLPALKRVKRISSSNKSGPFVGSEFAYEDMSSQEVEKYTYKYSRDENLDGRDTFVVERFPVDKKSGYTRQIVWMDQEEYRIWQVEYYDRKHSLLKTLTFSGYDQYLDRYWRPRTMDMVNHQTGKSTTLEWSNYQFNNGYTDKDFNRNSLMKIK